MRTAVIFLAGFAGGVLFLGVLVSRTHSVETIRATSVLAAPPLAAAPSVVASQALSDLLIPVEGVTARALHPDFDEMGGGHRHEALDILAPRGTPVRAAAAGNVAKLFLSKPGGLTVYQFDETRNWCFYYAHLDHYAAGLTEGARLRQGEVLGYVGTSGNSPPDTPHLHFAIFKLGPEKHWWQGTGIDPYPLLGGR